MNEAIKAALLVAMGGALGYFVAKRRCNCNESREPMGMPDEMPNAGRGQPARVGNRRPSQVAAQ